ncbi:hypothetical protein BA950_15155 [Erythrobacter sp. SAORIC-644]|nr:hypothetical protein [Erythrobacteraceae bacterium]PNQ74122.1 hypothetical protein BA950_15155 [Erythrobacter sp. SAORIC-644]
MIDCMIRASYRAAKNWPAGVDPHVACASGGAMDRSMIGKSCAMIMSSLSQVPLSAGSPNGGAFVRPADLEGGE